MPKSSRRLRLGVSRFFSDYSMLGVLALLCVYFSAATFQEQYPAGEEAGRALAAKIVRSAGPHANVVIVARGDAEDGEFAEALQTELRARGLTVAARINGEPPAVRQALERLVAEKAPVDTIAASGAYRTNVREMQRRIPALAQTRIVAPESYFGPAFLTRKNLLNVASHAVVVAVMAVGMTMVIITGGIDLSVGSLVALSAVVTSMLIVRSGGAEAGAGAMALASLAGIAVCAAVGAFSGLMITTFKIPPFIATLAMMQVASGLAYIVTHSGTIYDIPLSFTWLGRGADLFSIPNAVILMLAVYAIAHLVMSRTRLGRYLYAVGGNRQAARLSGIRISRILVIAYIVSGVMAGLGGVIEASQQKAGGPNYGLMYELHVIAATVVGGISLAGGEGKILGALVGAITISVINNGMNLTGVQPHTQRVVFGLVILGAVLLDSLKRHGWRGLTQAE